MDTGVTAATATTTTMAGTSASSSSTTASGQNSLIEETHLGDINFEELIKASNVSSRAEKTKDESRGEEKTTKMVSSTMTATTTTQESNQKSSIASATTTATITTAANLPKIAPKTTTVSAAAAAAIKAANPGQVVIIQSPSGNPVPIRIAGSSNSSNSQGGKQSGPVTIQVLKMPDGRLVQIKNNKALNLTNLSNVTQLSVGTKKPTTTTANPTIIVKNNSNTITAISTQGKLQTTAGAPTANTIAGILKSKSNELIGKQLQRILPASSTAAAAATTSSSTTTIKSNNNSPTTTTTSSSSNILKQNTQKIILPENKEIRIKSEESGLKQILVPQHLLKLSPNNTTGPIQAIEIPGKQGLQYVRVLGTASSSVATTKSGTILTGIRAAAKDAASPTKMSVIPHVTGNQKIIMASRPRQQVSIATGSSTSATGTQISGKQQKSLLTTVPTLRKINESSVSKNIVHIKEEDDPISVEIKKEKITQLNQTIKKFSSNGTNATNATSNGQHQSGNQNTKTRLMVPLEIFRKMQSAESIQVSKQSKEMNTKKLYSVLKPSTDSFDETSYSTVKKRSPSPDGLPRRKHCNCTKSQCLKLYCDCFANGEFCQDCNCKECFNNLEYEDERQKAIKICLERNPNAFKPKITKARDQSDLRLHNKGCNCKRSGCLKNYCECYEAKIACSSNCKCFGCRNVEDRSEMDPVEVAKIAQNFGRGIAIKRHYDEISTNEKSTVANTATSSSSSVLQPPPNKQPYNFITQDVVDATIQCMIAQADECKKNGINNRNTERMILEELGRCLVEIIDFSIRNMDN